MRCSLRMWLLSTSILLFIMSLLFTFSHNGTEAPLYAELGEWSSAEGHPVRLVPGYPGVRHRPSSLQLSKDCSCRHCLRQPGGSTWFDSHYNAAISPVWTLENQELPTDVQHWWMMLQPSVPVPQHPRDLDPTFPDHPAKPLQAARPLLCRRCAVINQAPTLGFENDVGSRTTHHFMYPESAKNLPTNVSFVLVPFKALDLLWITSALSTGQIRFTYAPVKAFLRVDKDKVQIYNPAFFKYIHDRWTEHHGRYPSTGMLVLFFALHVCDEVNVFGFGADNRGNWHHYWENNRYAGEFRKTGVHDADFEAQLIDTLTREGKIKRRPT
ncbi:hypothetical protein GDO81_015663 [Engystomops pustulosus]|uniref:CMP-N-acetylneuraminate-beta-galactosamide-alpha-2,3-sialyltransferase 2 n=1 Tax=Engystomops pustulosus TaxID=76066 RepID=A0AAV7AT30_ENGPU|nr:hypothetical protein GDO81_015663 [Engystomops pustulosus]